MELFFNECSLHGQFTEIKAFESAIETVMLMRQTAKKYNHELYCHRNCTNAAVTHQLTLPQAIHLIDKNKARALMGWIGQAGPYWEDDRQHPANEYFECRQDVVTDTTIGECAFLEFSSRQAQLTSVTPSNWTDPKLTVVWHKDDGNSVSNQLTNHISNTTLETVLANAEPPIQSWDQLEQRCRQNYQKLHFSVDAFTYLKGKPFVSACAKSFIDLMDVLSSFKTNHLPTTGRTPKGHELYQTYFTGDMAWFSDSTDKEKSAFETEMTFPHPEKIGETLFAPYHGKVKCRQMRMHFTWPISADSPVYVLYVGDKITKK